MKRAICVLFWGFLLVAIGGWVCASSAGSAAIFVARVVIPAGKYMMGDQSGEAWAGTEDERPAHPVSVSSFELGAYEVTVAQFAEFLNEISAGAPTASGAVIVAGLPYAELKKSSLAFRGGRYLPAGDGNIPVIVTWYGADAFCKFVGGRLPTEAEWEYACRAGTTTAYPWGERFDETRANGRDTIDEYGMQRWVWKTQTADGRERRVEVATTYRKPSSVQRGALKPVGSYPANRWGLYDMIGNAAEWCQDWYSRDYYSWCVRGSGGSPVADPVGPAKAAASLQGTGRPSRVVRGGMYHFDRRGLRSSSRGWGAPDECAAGFRVAFPGAKRTE